MIRLSIIFLLSVSALTGQKSTDINPPYHQIPDAPSKYSIQTVLARMIDGLGYRYYWATKDLREEDLNYNPGNEGRPTKDVLEHIYGLSSVVLNSIAGQPNLRPSPKEELTWPMQREKTLQKLKLASNLLKGDNAPKPEDIKITFKRGEKTSDFALWTLLNGPLEDAIYHTGQIASFRRSSGNPVHPGMNVFMGKTKE